MYSKITEFLTRKSCSAALKKSSIIYCYLTLDQNSHQIN